MSMSLREQLLAAGLVSKKQAKQVDQQQRQQPRDRHTVAKKAAEQQLAAQKAQAAKAARDQELNRQQQEKAERKARMAEIRQLIDQNRVPKIESDEYYNFIAGKKIRRIAVTPAMREQLIRGELVVVRSEGRSEIVPAEIAARIRDRDERVVIPYNAAPAVVDENDPYKDHVVPDDLMW